VCNSPRSAKNDAIPSPETAHYVTFLLPDWSVHRTILLPVIAQLTHLHRLNLVAMQATVRLC